MLFSAEIDVGNFRNIVVAIVVATAEHTIDILMIVDVIIIFGARSVDYQRLCSVIGDETCPNTTFSVPIGTDFKVLFFGIKNIVEEF